MYKQVRDVQSKDKYMLGFRWYWWRLSTIYTFYLVNKNTKYACFLRISRMEAGDICIVSVTLWYLIFYDTFFEMKESQTVNRCEESIAKKQRFASEYESVEGINGKLI
jgi:hypothetical protein